MLVLRDISKAFVDRSEKLEVLTGIGLTVPRGTLVSIVGPSGCGKTTLLRIIAGLEQPDAGTALVEDKGRGIRPKSIGMAFQEPTLLAWRNLAENVYLPFELCGANGINADEAVRRAIASVHLDGFERYRPSQMSGGMRARAALARALVIRPALLLLDEVFASVDEMTRSTLHAMLLDLLAEYRTTTVLVTHSIWEACILADQVVVMSARPAQLLGKVDIPMSKEERINDPDSSKLAGCRRDVRRLLLREKEAAP